MRFSFIFALATATTSLALTLNELEQPALVTFDKRDGAFSANTTTATGDTCADAFGEGYVTCREKSATRNRLCFNPSVGQTCCSNDWACPAGGFCSTNNGLCCPTGMSAAECAGIKSSSSAAPSSTWSSVSGWASSTSSSMSSKSSSTWSYPANSTTKAWGSVTSKKLNAEPTSSCSYNVTETYTSTYYATSTPSKTMPVAQFTGAATMPKIEMAGVLAALGAAAALL